MRLLRSQSGFAYIQGMAIAAFVATSALIATRMMTNQKMAMKSAETKDQIIELHKQIFTVLQNKEHCLRTLSTPLATVAINSTYDVNDIRTKPESTGTGHILFVTNSGTPTGATYMNGHVRINTMKLKTTADLSAPQPLVVNYYRLEGKEANGVRSGVGYGGKSITKNIYIRLQRPDPTSNTISGCYAIEADADSDTGSGNTDLNKEFCERLGTGTGEAQSLYTWDETRNTCVLKDHVCPDKYVFEGINSTGLAICRPFADYLPYFLESGSNSCSSTKTAVRLSLNASGKVEILCESTGSGTCTYEFTLYEFAGCGGNVLNNGFATVPATDAANCAAKCTSCGVASKIEKIDCTFNP